MDLNRTYCNSSTTARNPRRKTFVVAAGGSGTTNHHNNNNNNQQRRCNSTFVAPSSSSSYSSSSVAVARQTGREGSHFGSAYIYNGNASSFTPAWTTTTPRPTIDAQGHPKSQENFNVASNGLEIGELPFFKTLATAVISQLAQRDNIFNGGSVAGGSLKRNDHDKTSESSDFFETSVADNADCSRKSTVEETERRLQETSDEIHKLEMKIQRLKAETKATIRQIETDIHTTEKRTKHMKEGASKAKANSQATRNSLEELQANQQSSKFFYSILKDLAKTFVGVSDELKCTNPALCNEFNVRSVPCIQNKDDNK